MGCDVASSITVAIEQALTEYGGNVYLAFASAMDGICAAAGRECQNAAGVSLNLPDVVSGTFTDAAGQACIDVGSYLPVACYQHQGGQYIAAPLAVEAVTAAPAYRPRDPAGLDAFRPTLTGSGPSGGAAPAASVPEASSLWLALLGVAVITIARGAARRI